VVLDLEDPASLTARTVGLTQEERTDMTVAFCETVREAGYTPMLYCNIRWFMEELDLTRLTEYDKWFAQYFNRPFFPYEYQMWQYTNNGRVDGITGPVDLNLSFVDYGQD
jgi:GH25 family lysozyme M1 (1,4-beta-N-acetylmuramidase)